MFGPLFHSELGHRLPVTFDPLARSFTETILLEVTMDGQGEMKITSAMWNHDSVNWVPRKRKLGSTKA
jgi:hypothetical protein